VSDSYPGAPEQPQPPWQPGTPEYLEAGAGAPLGPDTPAATSGGGGRRRGLLIGGGVAVLAVVGVGAWAATQFFATGAQPSEALPASTLGYASIDLDPSGAQKVEAVRTLNKFPAFKDELDLDLDDDIRQKVFDEIDLPPGCQLFYEEDIEPWLGERMAVAAVDVGDKDPEIVFVVQVKDEDAADDGLTKLRECNPEGDTMGGWVIDGGWAVVAETSEGAQAVVDATDEGTLADDPEFQELTAAAGSAGIVTLYAAPEAGAAIADSMEGMTGFAEELEQGLTGTDTLGELTEPGGDNAFAQAMRDFKGAAVAIRFDDGALEIEGAGDTGIDLSAIYGTDRGADVVETLPADTAAAVGAGFDEGWLTQWVEQVTAFTGGEMTADELFAEASASTGLEIPQDAETLLGRSMAVSFGSDFDLEAFFNSGDPSDVPVALKVQGDVEAAKAVIDKVVAQDPEAGEFLGIDSDGDVFVIGPDADYRQEVLAKGSLGTNDVYRDVIRESDKASAVFYVNFNAGDDWLVRAVGDSDPSVAENLKPLAGFGIAVWKDDDWTHGVLRLTTD
jgi:hypothetical protein